MSQLVKKFLADNAVADEKIRLDNDSYLRARDAGNVADINILKLDATDEVVLADNIVKPATNAGVQLGSAGKHFSGIFVREIDGDGAQINLKTSIKPDTDNSLTVGTATRRFGTVYSVQVDSQADDLELNTSANISVQSNVVPQADGTSDLGSTVNRFFTAFLKGGISALDQAIPVVTDLGVTIKSDSTSAPGQIAVAENNGTNSVGFKAPTTLGATTIWELPAGDGTSNQVLKTDGAGVLSWTTVSASGANTTLSNLGTTSINAGLTPNANNTFALGTSGANWSELWALAVKSSSGLSLEGTQVNLVSNAASVIGLSGDGTTAVSVQFYDNDLSAYVALKAPSAVTASFTLALPTADGTANQVLKTDGSGQLGWTTASGATNNKETFTLSGTDITNQYIDFAQVARTGSVHLIVKGGPATLEGASYDYSLSYTGGAGGKTRLTFLNDLATGGASALVAGDILQVVYEY